MCFHFIRTPIHTHLVLRFCNVYLQIVRVSTEDARGEAYAALDYAHSDRLLQHQRLPAVLPSSHLDGLPVSSRTRKNRLLDVLDVLH